jgi:hypothetical protein
MIKQVKIEIVLNIVDCENNYNWIFQAIEEQLEVENGESLIMARFLEIEENI